MRHTIFGLFVFFTVSTANAVTCRQAFDPNDISTDVHAQAQAGYDSLAAEVVRTMEVTRQSYPGFEHATNSPIREAIEALIQDEELSAFHIRINETLVETNARASAVANRRNTKARAEEFRTTFFEVLHEQLAELMPETQATERVEAFAEAESADKEIAQYYFGGLSATQARYALVAGSRGTPASYSLVGKYIDRARAIIGGDPSSITHAFVAGPPTDLARTHRGQFRLFVAVDDRTAPLVQELFGYNPNLLIHRHEPGQGTLQLFHYSWNINYARYTEEGAINLPVNSIMPLIVLSTTEASRVINYFDLGHLTNQARSKYPWSLFNPSTGRTYITQGGYSCCTHWVGEMPFGDGSATEYATAGQWEQGERQMRPSSLNPYSSFRKPDGTTEEIGHETRIDRLTRIVWKTGSGARQFWDVLGLHTGMSRAELVNPGWVLYNLLGDATAERVPVVFVWTADATQPLSPAVLDNLRNTISTH